MTSRKPSVTIRRAPVMNPELVERFVADGRAGPLGSQEAERAETPTSGLPGLREPETLDVQRSERPDAPSPDALGVQQSAHPDAQEPGRGLHDGSARDVQALSVSEGRTPDASGPPTPERPGTRAPRRLATGTAGLPERRTPTGGAAPGAPQPVPAATRRGLVHRQDGRVRRRTTVYLPPELVGELAARCVYDGRELSDTIADAVRSYLKGG